MKDAWNLGGCPFRHSAHPSEGQLPNWEMEWTGQRGSGIGQSALLMDERAALLMDERAALFMRGMTQKTPLERASSSI